MTPLSNEEDESDEEERYLVEALNVIVAHTIYVNDEKKSSDSEQEKFLYMVTVHETTDFASVTARLQDAAVEHVVTANKPDRFGNVFREVLLNNGAAKGSTACRLQYQAYCTTTCQDPKIDSSKAAKYHFCTGSAR